VRDAVFGVALRGGQLVVVGESELVVLEAEDGIRAPLVGIVGTATRAETTAPLVGEDDLAAIVGERSGMPVGIVGIVDGVDALGIDRVFDVEQNSVAGAGAGCQPMAEYTVMSWHWSVSAGFSAPFLPWVPPLFRPLSAPVRGSIKTRGLETIFASCGAATEL
jgi:hypothetical protein